MAEPFNLGVPDSEPGKHITRWVSLFIVPHDGVELYLSIGTQWGHLVAFVSPGTRPSSNLTLLPPEVEDR